MVEEEEEHPGGSNGNQEETTTRESNNPTRAGRRYRGDEDGGSNERARVSVVRGRRVPSSAASAPAGTGDGGDVPGAPRSSARAMMSSTSLTHEDEIERIREIRARRLREEGAGPAAAGAGAATDSARPELASSPRIERSRVRRAELAVSSRSIASSSSGGSSAVNPSRMLSTPMISRRELEEAGLVRERRTSTRGDRSPLSSARDLSPRPDLQSSSRSINSGVDEGSGYGSRTGVSIGGGGGGGGEGSAAYALSRSAARREDVNASSYSRARRERLSAATATAAETVDDANAHPSSTSPTATSRERDYIQRADIEARMAARRSRRSVDELASSRQRSEVVGGTGPISLEELRSSREEPQLDRRLSMSDRSNASMNSRNTLDSQGSGSYSEQRHVPRRSNTSESLQASARERIRERLQRGIPERAKSAGVDLSGLVLSDSQHGDNLNTDSSAETLDEAETTRLEGQQRPSRVKSTDLSVRLRERREARAAEREARERGRMDYTDTDISRRGSGGEDFRHDIGREVSDDVDVDVNRRGSARDVGGGNTEDRDLDTSRRSSGGGEESSYQSQSRGIEDTNPEDDETPIPDIEITDDEDEGDTATSWSVRLCVISAMDLPLNVVPNMPLCPVLKFGLVKIPGGAKSATEQSATSAVMKRLGKRSIESVQSAKVRTTTPKVLSKRDNGTVDFHQEYRWDQVKRPMDIGLCVELCARAVRTPRNYKESPPALSQHDPFDAHLPPRPPGSIAGGQLQPSEEISQSSTHTDSQGGLPGSEDASLRRFWGRGNRKQAELEAAEAAAAVARMLVDQENVGEGADQTSKQAPENMLPPIPSKLPIASQSDYEVTLSATSIDDATAVDMTEDVRLGSLVIPLTKLPLDKATKGNQSARLEQWYLLETVEDSIAPSNRRKKPSVLLEISFSASETLDDSEDELEEGVDDQDDKSNSFSVSPTVSLLSASFSRRSSIEARARLKEKEKPQEEAKTEDPLLEPGVIDFVAVVGCKNIGDQKKDDGMKGWVNTTPESIIMEQFPPDNDFHAKTGRNVLLPEMVQWFCFPEGARLWRGASPPTHSDLNLKRFSAASPLNIASSIAAFDACLGCTTSFSWFVIASNSDEYGSSLVKTYGAVIRFYVPAPTGIDSTQDDFAHAVMGNTSNSPASISAKRLWVPIGICLTSNLPIIGVMEALLLRLCEEFSALPGVVMSPRLEEVHKAMAHLILNFQKPIAGAVNCSVPFIAGDRFLLTLPPRSGLPALPHGRAIVSVCRLLGAEGINFMIAAVLTECKILIHSQEIADIAMVAEVITALTYPFTWSLPYIPILPLGMIEFVEAPLSYILGIPSCNLHLIDPRAFDDVVVVDLDSGFSSPDYFQGKRPSKVVGSNKYPTPLPASVATSISKAVYKVLRAEEQVEEEFGADLGDQSLPRLEAESLAEREFRVTVAVEICGLLRGYQECVGPVFDRDKFLRTAPALFEERRESRSVGPGVGSGSGNSNQKTLSVRSKRFLSMLVNSQNFQQLMESLSGDEATFFDEIMEAIDESSSDARPPARNVSSGDNGLSKTEKIIAQLVKSLQKIEDKIPTYRVEKGGGLGIGDCDDDELFYEDTDFDDFPSDCDLMPSEERNESSFTTSMLSSIRLETESGELDTTTKQSVSMEYLAKLEESPWEYNPLLSIQLSDESDAEPVVQIHEKVKLRDAIGERRFRAWKLAQDKKADAGVDLAFLPENTRVSKQGSALELNSLVSSARSNMSDTSALSLATSARRLSSLSAEQQKVVDAKSRDVIRRCLDRAQANGNSNLDLANAFVENGRDLMAESEKALRNPSAQLFLLTILAQRSRLENQRVRSMRRQSAMANSASRLDPIAFDCLVRLSCAMLDSCMEFEEYELAYRLLTYTAGFIMVLESDYDVDKSDGQARLIVTMTSRVGLHPIYANLGVWETVMTIHLRDRKSAKKSEDLRSNSDDESGDDEEGEVEYEAAVATLYEMLGYGIPGEELSRFAMRASEENGWFCDDRGRQLLMLARRISVRRDQADLGGTGDAGDIDMVRKSADGAEAKATYFEGAKEVEKDEFSWTEVGWCHPAAPLSRAVPKRSNDVDESSSPSVEDYMRRSAVTALASFGSSIVVSGGLDGGVFLAHSIIHGDDEAGRRPEVRGVHLDWGSASRAGAGSSSDGEYGVGAVSCLAAAYGGQAAPNVPSTKDTGGAPDDADLADSMEGSRVVAGTTAGDLRVWSVKDVYTAVQAANKEGGSSSNTSTRLKFSLRGRALSGHRGGVTCIDVPSQVYRPDSLVTGGADGLIKLWSLRAPTGGRRSSGLPLGDADSGNAGGQQRGRGGGDALSTLTGHTGRIQCIQSAWHGDHLLSGGADRTIRVWDLAASGGRCIHRLCGHFGWVTSLQYWGPNTVVSASTDRSVALWDARVRNSPLFMLRHHSSPVSDLLVGSRTDPYMVSAGADGTVATWDFRCLSDGTSGGERSGKKETARACKIVRVPSASVRHGYDANDGGGGGGGGVGSGRARRTGATGPVYLARGVKDPSRTFLSVGSDAILQEWDVATGEMLGGRPTGHCDAVSSFRSFSPLGGGGGGGFPPSPSPGGGAAVSPTPDNGGGTLSSSWDGTIRMRRLVRRDDV